MDWARIDREREEMQRRFNEGGRENPEAARAAAKARGEAAQAELDRLLRDRGFKAALFDNDPMRQPRHAEALAKFHELSAVAQWDLDPWLKQKGWVHEGPSSES